MLLIVFCVLKFVFVFEMDILKGFCLLGDFNFRFKLDIEFNFVLV